jgi:hypothetical protein
LQRYCIYAVVSQFNKRKEEKKMAKGTISRKTFAKGITAGVVIAGSLGLLQNLEYSPTSFTPGDMVIGQSCKHCEVFR